MAGFQKQINLYSSPASEGWFASGNPRAWYVAGPGAVVSGPVGLNVARFAWATPVVAGDTPERADNNALLVAAGLSRVPSGFVVNEQQANWFTNLLQESGMTILPGQAVELLTRGDVWVKSPAGVPANRGQKVFANMVDGTVSFGSNGATVSGSAVTASFATNVMTVTAGSNIKPGSAVVGAGLPANTFVLAQLTGTTGGAGTYSLTTTPGTVASQSNIVSDYVETRFVALSAALAGEFVKIGFGD